jgi:hypothetical protein
VRFLLLLCSAALLSAQVESAGGLFRLTQPWKVQAGDDLRWADPALDDSTWKPESSLLGHEGFAWYRQTLTVPAVEGPLYFRVPYILRAAEFYANGEKIGEHGNVAHWWKQRRDPVEPMALPRALRPGDRLIIAIRVAMGGAGPGVSGTPVLGSAGMVQAGYSAQFLDVVRRSVVSVWISFFPLLTALVALLYWRGRSDRREALWFAGINLGFAMGDFEAWRAIGALQALTVPAGLFAVFSFWAGWRFFRGEESIPWRRQVPYLAVLFVLSIAILLGRFQLILWNYPMAMLGVVSAMFLVLNSVSALHRVRRGEAWLGPFFLAYLLATAGDLLQTAEWVIAANTFQQVGMLMSWTLVNSTVPISLRSIGELVAGAVMAYLLARRVQGLIRDKQALDAELEAARQVQALLLQPAGRSPGYLVQTSYRPAREVGGDFYFTSALPGDALLLVTGDVSGKGLRAAMLVNLVIGALRRESTGSPAEVLAGLNQVLCGQTAGGFVTCCCARFDPGGAVTVANAGHLPPYVDGAELEIAGGLPLGVSPDATSEETVVRGEYFTFVSDGVVEAANSQAELFGFDRTRHISAQPAGAIAEAARAWGQNDDITVVTVRRTL